jgi:hypothetical protein
MLIRLRRVLWCLCWWHLAQDSVLFAALMLVVERVWWCAAVRKLEVVIEKNGSKRGRGKSSRSTKQQRANISLQIGEAAEDQGSHAELLRHMMSAIQRAGNGPETCTCHWIAPLSINVRKCYEKSPPRKTSNHKHRKHRRHQTRPRSQHPTIQTPRVLIFMSTPPWPQHLHSHPHPTHIPISLPSLSRSPSPRTHSQPHPRHKRHSINL